MRRAWIALLVSALPAIVAAQSEDRWFFHSTDPLAARDEWGLVHQGSGVNSTDTAPRYHWRPLYWLEGGHDLAQQPAYVGALQRELRRRGYYCGEIDGIFSPEVSDAVARMQKSYSMRVTGTITIPVRRALFLP
jgi:Putative peptidoglycan binding domain